MIALWSMVMVHGLMVADLGGLPQIIEMVDSRDWPSTRRASLGVSSNVVAAQAGYLARPTTEAPETQFYFTTHRSGAFPVPRVRTVVRGERASRSIVNRTTAL